ncbi:MAG: hypothetical protein [Anelloviridae sp.]|nr:MAG: hypothetical protein [Anelloviridae sp.]
MSDYVTPQYTKKQLNLQIVNCYVGIHDLHCHCKEPLRHIIQQITTQEPTIKQWLDSTTAASTNQDGEKDIDGFEPGELERLFAEEDDAKEG